LVTLTRFNEENRNSEESCCSLTSQYDDCIFARKERYSICKTSYT